MKKLILSLLLTPFLLVSQPQFSITDYNGNTWDSNELLEQGITIVIQFYSPSITCWPSSNSIELFTEAYNKYASCNKVFFLQVAEWGSEYQVVSFLEIFGTTEIPTLVGYEGGQDLTWEFVDNWGLQWAYELWLLRPDGTYEVDIPWAWDLEQTVLINTLEDENFNECSNNVLNIEELEINNNDKTTYDITGRVIQNPTQGFYIQENKKYFKSK